MNGTRREAVVIGTSAGAIDALSAVLPKLPADFPLAILVVVHLPAHHDSLLVELFSAKSRLEVQEPDDKEPIRPGVVYLAPPNYHMLVEQERLISLSTEEPVNYCRPSIDLLFESAARAYGSGLIGIVLTGANQDGAAGLKQIVELGGMAIVQRPETAYSPVMPESARKACPEAHLMDLSEIAVFLQESI